MVAVSHFPVQTTPFVGREAELAKLTALFAQPDCHLVTLTGLGGIGKTRLAQEAGLYLAHHFAHGSSFISLAPIHLSSLIVPVLASSLGYFFRGGEPPKTQLLNFLHHHELLLILDNFEHLMDGIDLIPEIIQAAPDVRLLITSRERLNLREEWVLDVAGLDHPTHSEPISELTTYSAIQFFLQSAQRVKGDFQLSQSNLAEVVRICRLVEGMPLGLELAASWVRSLSCGTIGDEIQRNFDFLSSHLYNMPENHRSLRAVFAHSYHLLLPEQQHIFSSLSVFRGGLSREAAEMVAGASFGVLATLVDKSLLRMDNAGRYDLHEMLRQYGDEQLKSSGMRERLREAHSLYYAAFIFQRVEDLKGRRQLEAMAEVNADFENVRTAWNWAAEHQREDIIDLMLEGLEIFSSVRNRETESDVLFRYAKAQFADETGVQRLRLWGRLTARISPGDDAEHQLHAALEIAERYEDQVEVAKCLEQLGGVAYNKRDYVLSDQLLQQCLSIYRALGDRFRLSSLLFRIQGHGYQEPWEHFKRYGEEALRLKREIGDQVGVAWAIAVEATAQARLGNFAESERLWMERVAFAQQIGNLSLMALGYGHASYMSYFLRGDFTNARTAAEESLKIEMLLRSRGGGYALATLGLLACMDEQYEEGKNLCRRADSTQGLAWISDLAAWGACLAACGEGDFDTARSLLRAALKFLDKFCGLPGIISIIATHAVLLAQTDPVRAVEWLALAFHHSRQYAGWVQKWPLLERLCAMLEQSLGARSYAAAWERGVHLDVEVVANILRQQMQASPDIETTTILPPAESLTTREIEILRWVAEGLSNNEIADQLILAPSTVKWYMSEILSKLHATSRTQAVTRARALNLLS